MIHNSFFQAVCRVGIFMICAQAIVHFRPNESYEKYLKLLMSTMVLMQLCVPVGSFLFGGGSLKAVEIMERFEKEFADNMQEAEKSAQEADRLLEQMALEEVRRRAEEEKREADAAVQEEEISGTEGATGTNRTSGTERDSGTEREAGGTDKTEENRTEGRGEIRIELDGIEPIKIGQEE